jgi:hypothetical protein
MKTRRESLAYVASSFVLTVFVLVLVTPVMPVHSQGLNDLEIQIYYGSLSYTYGQKTRALAQQISSLLSPLRVESGVQ